MKISPSVQNLTIDVQRGGKGKNGKPLTQKQF